jgi:hypothetical protein
MSKTVVEMNREAWLTEVANRIVPFIEPHAKAQYGDDWKMPNFRVTVGFPSQRALSSKKRRIGECWPGQASKDGAHEIVVSPLTIQHIEKEMQGIVVAGVVAHELVHAADRNIHGHQGPFVKIIRAIGLTGKPTATTEGPVFIAAVQPILTELPALPLVGFSAHAAFKKQATAMLKTVCPVCGYILRSTEKWLSQGIPDCPVCRVRMRCPSLGL